MKRELPGSDVGPQPTKGERVKANEGSVGIMERGERRGREGQENASKGTVVETIAGLAVKWARMA